MDSNIPITIMSVSAAFGRKRTTSQRVLENADPLVLKKKAQVVHISCTNFTVKPRELNIFFNRLVHLFLKRKRYVYHVLK